MSFRRRCVIPLLGLAALPLAAPAQEHQLTLADGSTLLGVFERIAGSGEEANLILRQGGERHAVPLARVLGWHRAAPAGDQRAPAVARLVGGQELRGELMAGDRAGETFVMRSPSLGDVRVLVDRMQAILFARQAGEFALEDLVLPEGADQDEALFRRAGRGLDVVVGAIQAFGAQGIDFVWGEAEAPRLFRYGDLIGIALRGGAPPQAGLPFQVVTRSGDVLRVQIEGGDANHLQLRWEGGVQLRLPLSDLAAVTNLGGGRRFLSDLPPQQVEQSDGLGPIGSTDLPLLPFRLDRTVGGSFLSTEGWCHGKGIGVHAVTRMTWRVPDGARQFFAKVAFSEDPLLGDVRGDADVRVRRGDEVLFEVVGLRAGQPARSTGLIPVRPGELLTLEVGAGRGLSIGDRVNWLSAVFLP